MTSDDKCLHDFKNQLAIILGFSEMLLAEAEAGDLRGRDFEAIHAAAVSALDLAKRLFPVDASTIPSRAAVTAVTKSVARCCTARLLYQPSR